MTGGSERRSGEGFARETYSCPHCGGEHPVFVSRCSDSGKVVDRAFKMEGMVLEGKYQVGRRIGRGGMGVVHEGVHLKMGRKVAIKFLLSKVADDPTMLARFENEARVAASIGHRNIVDIYDLGETPQGVHYIVMEYMEGRDLGNVLSNSRGLTVAIAVDFTIQILSALRAVHDQGIIHRDLKPENVIVTKTDSSGFTLKLLDFGLSRLGEQGADVGLTRTGTVFGTPRYMAPEQARAQREIDGRADLYSAGVILYRMLTGRLPFEADTYNEMIIKITTEEPVHVSAHGVPIPGGLQEVVMRSISRDPLHRFESATSFFEAVRPFRSWTDEGVVSSSTPPPQPILGWSGIRRGIERPRGGGEADPASESSHRYSYKGNGSSGMVDIVGPRRVIPRLKLGTEAGESSPGAAASAAPDRRGSHTYSVVRAKRRDTDPNMVDRVSVSQREDVDSMTELGSSAEAALRRAMLSVSRKQPKGAAGPAPRRRRDSTSPWTFAEVTVGQPGQARIEEPDDSVSTIGWEGPAGARRSRGLPVWAVAASVAFVILIGAGALTLFLKLRSVETKASEVSAANGNHEAEPVAEPVAGPPVHWKVELRGLPEGAEVYVDGALHPEMPVVVENRARPHMFRVVADGYEPWEKEVAVYSDISMNVPVARVAVAGEVVAEEGKKGKKNGKGKASSQAGTRIDTVYPGLH